MAAGGPRLLTVAALVAYDGSEYFGFQVQPGVPTIQGALEQALSTFTSLDGRVVGAGRTDTGVHARGQVVSARVAWKHPLSALQRAWNAHLPPSIGVRAVQEAQEGFHPRFSARSRTYRYSVVDFVGTGEAALHSPLRERFAHFERRRLDVAAMQVAAGGLLGRRDFAAFGQPPQGTNSVRTVLEATWTVGPELSQPGQDERLSVLTITADAFLQHMVRRIVGSLLAVGRGEWSVERFVEVVANRDPSGSAPPAGPQGLVLERVDYGPEWAIEFGKSDIE